MMSLRLELSRGAALLAATLKAFVRGPGIRDWELVTATSSASGEGTSFTLVTTVGFEPTGTNT